MDMLEVLPAVIAFLLGIVTCILYHLYGRHFRDQVSNQQSFKSSHTSIPVTTPDCVPDTIGSSKLKSVTKPTSTKTATTNTTARSATQSEDSLSFKDTVEMLGKWAEEIENDGEFKISLDMEKKRKFLGGLFAERVVVEGFRAQQKKVRFL
ncbi:hypothetical protein IFR04_004044 [Cadophora malorum]|uniref:Uncharacterized protein n=1 Tax=Cadophora malorum TaxID=108018 RepID=A0A8H7WDG7_9HELO|nr:hypothetical protein IFR04_004044 [Cadophora malorum]